MQRFKYFLIICCLLFLQNAAFAQPVSPEGKDITGLWKGFLHNDTTGRDLRYEIAISAHKGKLSGYSHTFFILNDKEYYGVKKVKVRIQDDKIIILDEQLIANNYPEAPAKNVKQLNILALETGDNNFVLTGPFTTNRTKEYHALTGSIRVQRKSDYWNSALVPHLEELGLTAGLSFIPAPTIAITKPIVVIPAVIAPKPIAVKKEPVQTTVTKIFYPAADVDKRKTETVQSVFYKSDSLVLTLYDNGEVDGDTVTVLMNGKLLMPMVGLSTKAVRRTIYITKDMPDSIQLVMYAENLGSIPPNTGLLVVHDGEDIYEIRFSGDYGKNAAIVFKRR